MAARIVGNIVYGKLEWTGTTKEIIPESEGAAIELTAMASIVNIVARRPKLTGASRLIF